MSQERRPSVGFWATVVLVAVPFVYGLSFGPACGLVDKDVLPMLGTSRVYRPLIRAAGSDFSPAAVPLQWWAQLFSPNSPKRTGSSIVRRMDMSLDMFDLVRSLNMPVLFKDKDSKR